MILCLVACCSSPTSSLPEPPLAVLFIGLLVSLSACAAVATSRRDRQRWGGAHFRRRGSNRERQCGARNVLGSPTFASWSSGPLIGSWARAAPLCLSRWVPYKQTHAGSHHLKPLCGSRRASTGALKPARRAQRPYGRWARRAGLRAPVEAPVSYNPPTRPTKRRV